jgi:serine/threonine protein kinase
LTVGAAGHARERFVREGRAIAALNHPNICALYDVGDMTGLPPASAFYLVMEYLEGETLAARMNRSKGRCLPLGEALRYAIQIASLSLH